MGSKTVAIIGARLTSTRLPGKQLLPLAGLPIISHIVRRLREVSEISQIIVATPADRKNAALWEWAEGNNVVAFAWSGDENDVVGRIDAAFQETNADRFVYVCGDCPFIEPSVISRLIEASDTVVGTGMARLAPPEHAEKYIHEGFDVFNRGFWERMVAVAKEPFEREHVGAVYFHLNKVVPDEINWITDSPKFAEVDHRLSVDTPQDYAFASKLYEDWYHRNPASSIVDLKWVVDQIKLCPDLASLNAHVHQKTVSEVAPTIAIFCEAGPGIGMGHLSRACVAATCLQEHLGAAVELQIKGKPVEFSDLDLLPHEWVQEFSLNRTDVNCIITDVKTVDASLAGIIRDRAASCLAVGIDIVTDQDNLFDLLWVPSAHLTTDVLTSAVAGKVQYGLDAFLLRCPNRGRAGDAKRASGKSLIILTGGADPLRLSDTLPEKIVGSLAADVTVDWVQGPYARPPKVPAKAERFQCLNAPSKLHQKVADYDAALCVFGVTFYECLQAGTPAVAFDPLGAASTEEWSALKALVPDLIADDLDAALVKLASILEGSSRDVELGAISAKLRAGPAAFAHAVATGIGTRAGDAHAAA